MSLFHNDDASHCAVMIMQIRKFLNAAIIKRLGVTASQTEIFMWYYAGI